MGRAIRALLILVLLLGLAGGGAFFYAQSVYERPGPLAAPAQVVVPRGGAETIGAALAERGVVADGRFDVSQATNGAQITTLSGSGAVLLGGQVLTLTQASGNFSGSIQGSGGLAIAAGHEILSGANTYRGDTVLAQGARLTLEGEGSIANSRLVGLDDGQVSFTWKDYRQDGRPRS